MPPSFTLDQIRQALSLLDFDVAAAHARMRPVPRATFRPPSLARPARQGAVLLLLYPGPDGPRLVLIRRPENLNSHAGQIALPGGQQEQGETLWQTALRETQEEVGIPAEAIKLLGSLQTVYIPVSDYDVHPFVGWQQGVPSFQASPAEVAQIIEPPLATFTNPATRREETWNIRGYEVFVPYYLIGEHKVWGATAIILGEFVARLQQVAAHQSGPA